MAFCRNFWTYLETDNTLNPYLINRPKYKQHSCRKSLSGRSFALGHTWILNAKPEAHRTLGHFHLAPVCRSYNIRPLIKVGRVTKKQAKSMFVMILYINVIKTATVLK